MQRLDPTKGYRNAHLWMPLARIQNTEAVKNSLTFPMEQQTPIHAYYETSTHLVVPREYVTYNEYGTLGFDIEDRTLTDFPQIKVSCGAAPRDAVQATALAHMLEHGNGLLSLACGKGKTVISIMAWCKLNVPALVVVHTKDLMDQWVERIIEFTDLTREDIGIYRGKEVDWKKPVCIAMIQTLARRSQEEELPVGFENHFGVVIYDEVHHLGAPYFNTTATIGKGLRWGLSATPEREDGLDALYQYHIGPVLYENHEHDIIPDTYFIRTGVHVPTDVWPTLKDRTGEVNIPKLLTWLSKHPERNAKIVQTLNDALGENRHILALSSRVEHIDRLDEVYGDISGKIHGGVSDKKRKGVLSKYDLVFATTQLAKEGLDRKELDTLALLLPITKEGMFRQILGRIQRLHADKESAVVVIFEDDLVPICVHMCRKLRKILTELKYPFYIHD